MRTSPVCSLTGLLMLMPQQDGSFTSQASSKKLRIENNLKPTLALRAELRTRPSHTKGVWLPHNFGARVCCGLLRSLCSCVGFCPLHHDLLVVLVSVVAPLSRPLFCESHSTSSFPRERLMDASPATCCFSLLPLPSPSHTSSLLWPPTRRRLCVCNNSLIYCF